MGQRLDSDTHNNDNHQAANPQMASESTTTTNVGASSPSDRDVTSTTTQPHHPHHTLDDSTLGKYSTQMQSQLSRELARFDKENALRIGLVLGSSLIQDQAVRAMPSLISQCHLVAVTLLNGRTGDDDQNEDSKDAKEQQKDTDNKDDNDDDPHAETKDWLRKYSSGYPILERYMSTCGLDEAEDEDGNDNVPLIPLPQQRRAGRNSRMVPSYHSCGKLVVSSTGYTRRGESKDDEDDAIDDMDEDDFYYRDLLYYKGWAGYEDMLARGNVDAVYVLCPSKEQPDLVLMALKAKKHVLVYDPQSTNLEQFRRQVQQARESSRFVQFSTMLLHQYRVQTFLDSAAHQLHFGSNYLHHHHGEAPKEQQRANRMHLQLQIHTSDLPKIGLPRALVTHADAVHLNPKTDNCIRRLARYGILCALLLLEQQQYQGAPEARPVSVQITQSTCLRVGGDTTTTTTAKEGDECMDHENQDGRDLVVQAQGVVKFTQGRQLTFTVGYISHGPTRQVLEVHAPHRYATLNDLCLPGFDVYQEHAVGTTPATTTTSSGHSNGTFRIYETNPRQFSVWSGRASKRILTENDELQVTGGEAVDVLSGPPLHVRVWRGFAQLCRAVEAGDVTDDSDEEQEETKDETTTITTSEDKERIRQLQRQAEQYTRHSIQLKSILKNLEESQRRGHVEIPLNQEDYEVDA